MIEVTNDKKGNMKLWDKVARPPKEALKKITGGRLSGMTDIKPQWRYEIMTETCGPCGIGWKYDIVKIWTEPGPDEQVFAFAQINLYVLTLCDVADVWGKPVPGIGGSMLVSKEKGGLHANDEAYKMAITDALSSAMKMIGVAADIYSGLWDGSKYKTPSKDEKPSNPGTVTATKAQIDKMKQTAKATGWPSKDIFPYIKYVYGIEKPEQVKELSKAQVESLTKTFADPDKIPENVKPVTGGLCTTEQNKKIWALARENKYDDENLHEMVMNIFKKEHIFNRSEPEKTLTVDEAGKLIEMLEGKRQADD